MRSFLTLSSSLKISKQELLPSSIEHKSPDVAKDWLELMLNRVSEDIRSRDIQEAQDSIRFLEEQREKTDLVSLDEVFAQLIEEQTKTIMLANVSKDYVFDVIDPPSFKVKTRPSRALICVLGALLGGILGTVIVFARHYAKT